ncbi:hypothetical protein [Bacillus cereus]|uniref:hypothetical protein n=1 Tax=Bacillus cereus TaxID=1396 RepID=UPI000B4BD917|nr:hypothetical protein [Bacillus cereus]
MQTLKELFLIALLAFSSAFLIGNFSTIEKVEAACAPGQYANHGTDGLTSSGTCTGDKGASESWAKNNMVDQIVKIYNPIAGTMLGISILVIIYAAYKLIVSAGNDKKVAFAKRLLLGAGVSIIIILSTFTIVRLLMGLMKV